MIKVSEGKSSILRSISPISEPYHRLISNLKMIKPWSMTKSSSPTREVRENTRERRTARENVPDVLLDVTSTQWSNQSACASVACFQTVKAKCCLIDKHTGEYVAVGKAQKALCTKILSFFPTFVPFYRFKRTFRRLFFPTHFAWQWLFLTFSLVRGR